MSDLDLKRAETEIAHLLEVVDDIAAEIGDGGDAVHGHAMHSHATLTIRRLQQMVWQMGMSSDSKECT